MARRSPSWLVEVTHTFSGSLGGGSHLGMIERNIMDGERNIMDGWIVK